MDIDSVTLVMSSLPAAINGHRKQIHASSLLILLEQYLARRKQKKHFVHKVSDNIQSKKMCTSIWKEKYCHWLLQHGKNTHIYMDVNILQIHFVPAVFIYCDWMLMLIKEKKKKFHLESNSWRESVHGCQRFPQDRHDD